MPRRDDPAGLRWFVVPLALAIVSLLVVAVAAHRPLSRPPAELAATPIARAAEARIRLPPGRSLAVRKRGGAIEPVTSLLAVPERMHFGDYRWNDVGVPQGKVWVRVDLDRQLLSVFRSGQEIGTAVILYGTKATPTPTGWLTVLAKSREHYSRTYDAPMPYMLRLTGDGVALHASLVQRGRATHGCIGLPHPFAARLFDAVSVGDPVLIVGTYAS